MEQHINWETEGPWNKEINEDIWRDEATGILCYMRRNWLGAWCGYVLIEEDTSPLWGALYSNTKELEQLEVHGGVTFSGIIKLESFEQKYDLETHESRSGEFWGIGFDCSHGFDLTPCIWGMHSLAQRNHASYRDIEYVYNEVLKMCKQLIDMYKKPT